MAVCAVRAIPLRCPSGGRVLLPRRESSPSWRRTCGGSATPPSAAPLRRAKRLRAFLPSWRRLGRLPYFVYGHMLPAEVACLRAVFRRRRRPTKAPFSSLRTSPPPAGRDKLYRPARGAGPSRRS